MGEVVATLKIMPESPDVDLEALKAAIQAAMPAEAEFHKIEEEPISTGTGGQINPKSGGQYHRNLQ